MSRLILATCALGALLLFSGEAYAQFPVQTTFPTNGAANYGVPVYGNSGYGVPAYGYGYPYGYSAPYRSQAYPQGTSYLGPPVYTGYTSRYPRRYSRGYSYRPTIVYPQVRVQSTPAQSSTFGGAHSSQYFGDPHASQSFNN